MNNVQKRTSSTSQMNVLVTQALSDQTLDYIRIWSEMGAKIEWKSAIFENVILLLIERIHLEIRYFLNDSLSSIIIQKSIRGKKRFIIRHIWQGLIKLWPSKYGHCCWTRKKIARTNQNKHEYNMGRKHIESNWCECDLNFIHPKST